VGWRQEFLNFDDRKKNISSRCPSPGVLYNRLNLKRGWTAVSKPLNPGTQSCVRRARESSLALNGAALFNLYPQGLRIIASDHQVIFMESLDALLQDIPGQPTIHGCMRAAHFNRLLHQVDKLTISRLYRLSVILS
jgi:hypothetical protein